MMREPVFQSLISGLPNDWSSFGYDVFGCRYRPCPELHRDFFVCLMVFYKWKPYLGITAPKEIRDKMGMPRI